MTAVVVIAAMTPRLAAVADVMLQLTTGCLRTNDITTAHSLEEQERDKPREHRQRRPDRKFPG
jgi:hypothetical protein